MSSVSSAKGFAGRRARRQVVAEERAQHDVERDFAHVLRDIDRRRRCRGGRPSLGERVVRGVDVRHPCRDDLAVERRLHHLALRAPMLAFAGHEAVAEQDRHALDADALGEIGVVVDEHVAHVIRMRQHPQVAFERRRMHAERVAVLLEFAHENGERVGLERDVERSMLRAAARLARSLARAYRCYSRRFFVRACRNVPVRRKSCNRRAERL